MTVALQNYFKSVKPQEFASKVKDKDNFVKILFHLGLDTTFSVADFVVHLLNESKKLIEEEKRKEGLVILKPIKALLPQVPPELHVVFYFNLADSFLLANDYEGAKKSVDKASDIAEKIENPRLHVRVLNRYFIIHRTVGKDKAMDYLIKSREISEEHNFYDNIVFCDVNIGLIHFFKKEYNKAADQCQKVINLISETSYPNDKLLMPTDYFLQVFSENPGLAAASKYKDLILKAVPIVLRAIKQLKADYEATRRISILASILKISEELMEPALVEIDAFIEKLAINKRPMYYSSLAGGIGNYKEYLLSLI
jgi:tetratricopeptide (TPR) repeat protein